MRIVHATHAYHPAVGGAELYAKRIGEELAGLGHEVSVVTSNLAAAEGFYRLGVAAISPATEVVAGVSVTRVPVRHRGYRLASLLRPQGREGAWTEAILARMVASYQKGFEPHIDGADVVMALPHLFANVRAVISAHQREPFPLVMAPLLHEFDPNWSIEAMSNALQYADAVLALTDYEAGRLADAYRVAPETVFVCPPGVDMPQTPETPRQQSRVLYLGRMAATKGIELLAAAMEHVWAEHADAELVLAGPSDTGPGALASRRFGGKVTELGMVPEAEKTHLLRSAAVLVLPSATESFGIVLLEAMAHRTPVVAIDTPIAAEVVQHGRTGLLVGENARELGQAISRLIGDRDLAGALGAAGARWVRDERSWTRSARDAQPAYEHAVSRFEGA